MCYEVNIKHPPLFLKFPCLHCSNKSRIINLWSLKYPGSIKKLAPAVSGVHVRASQNFHTFCANRSSHYSKMSFGVRGWTTWPNFCHFKILKPGSLQHCQNTHTVCKHSYLRFTVQNYRLRISQRMLLNFLIFQDTRYNMFYSRQKTV